MAKNGDVVNQIQPQFIVLSAGQRMQSVVGNDDTNSANESGNMLAGLLPLAKRKETGRPTTSREKAMYEGLSKRARFCTICQRQRHKADNLP